MIHLTHSPEQTIELAARYAQSLVGGECLALEGDLGAGKTQFVRGLVQGLGGSGRSVSSPTFVLLNVYDSGRLKVFHLDAYRVNDAESFEAIGFDELLEQNGVVVVEWPSRVGSIIPADAIRIEIVATGESTRRITIAQGPP